MSNNLVIIHEFIVKDVDYFLWGSRAFSIDKTNNNLYLPDQASQFQSYLENTVNHYSYNRVPTVRESARLQSFPEYAH